MASLCKLAGIPQYRLASAAGIPAPPQQTRYHPWIREMPHITIQLQSHWYVLAHQPVVLVSAERWAHLLMLESETAWWRRDAV